MRRQLAGVIRRVCVVGNTASGKSYLANQIGQTLGLPVAHLDRLYWRADWTHAGKAEFLQAQQSLIGQDAWVVDGCFSEFGLSDRFKAADIVIFLDMPVWSCLKRAVLRRGTRREDLAGDDAAMGWRLGVAFLAEMVLFPLLDRPRIFRAAKTCRDRYRITSWDQEDALISILSRKAAAPEHGDAT